MRRLLLITAAAALLNGPAWAQSQSGWLEGKQKLLGPLRSQLMQSCADGRRDNALGRSYFEKLGSWEMTSNMMKYAKISYEKWIEMQSSLAAAMSEVCPEVK